MISPARALIWRQWRIVRVPTMATLLIALTCCLLDFATEQITGTTVGFGLFLACFGAIGFGLYLLTIGTDESNFSFSFPALLLRMPLSNMALTAIEFLGRVLMFAVVTGMVILSGLFTRHFVGMHSVQIDEGLFVSKALFAGLSIVVLFSFALAMCWWPGGRYILFVGVALTILLGPLRQLAVYAISLEVGIGYGLRLGVALCAIGTSYIIALGAVRLERRGGAEFPVGQVRYSKFRRARWVALPIRSQFSYEWYTTGRWIPAITAIFILGSIPFVYYLAFNSSPTPKDGLARRVYIANAFSPILLSFAAFTLGALVLRRDFEERRLLREFIFIRPIRTSAIARARFNSSIAGILMGGVLLAILGLFLEYTALHNVFSEEVRAGTQSLFEWRSWLFGLVIASVSAWVLLWLGVPIGIVWTSILFLMLFAKYPLGLIGPSGDGAETAFYAIAIVLGCAFCVLNYRMWTHALQRGIVSKGGAVCALVVSIGFVILFLAAMIPTDPATFITHRLSVGKLVEGAGATAAISIGALLVTFPMVAVPNFMDRLRHQ